MGAFVIYGYAARVVWRRWTDDEIAAVVADGGATDLRELAELLQRPLNGVRIKARQLGIQYVGCRHEGLARARVWTEDKIAYVREHAPNTPDVEIAAHLGVPVRGLKYIKNLHRIEGRGQSRKQSAAEVENRIAPLRGRLIVDRSKPRACTKCGEVKPVFLYPHENVIESGKCGDCRRAATRDYMSRMSPEERARFNRLTTLKHHGLTLDWYATQMGMQGDACLICELPFGEDRKPQIDHDHAHCPGSSGCPVCVRGLLCKRCNVSVGWVETFIERPDFLNKISSYLAV